MIGWVISSVIRADHADKVARLGAGYRHRLLVLPRRKERFCDGVNKKCKPRRPARARTLRARKFAAAQDSSSQLNRFTPDLSQNHGASSGGDSFRFDRACQTLGR